MAFCLFCYGFLKGLVPLLCLLGFLVMGHFELTALEAKDLVFLMLALWVSLEFCLAAYVNVCNLVCVVCGQLGLSSLLPPSKKGGSLMGLTSTQGERLGVHIEEEFIIYEFSRVDATVCYDPMGLPI